MAEADDLLDKLQDTREITHELLHDLTVNPVNCQEEALLNGLCDIHALVASAIRKATALVEAWPGEP